MDTWKMIYLARRNPALAPEDFPRAWREHSALGAQCGNVRDKVLSVTQCSRVLDRPDALPGASADYDGVNLLVLRDRQAADAIWDDPETLAIMRPDEPRVFSTYVRDFAVTARETVIVDGSRSDVCVVLFLSTRATPATDDAFIAPDAASPWARSQRLVLNQVEGHRPVGYEFDLIMEAWYASVGQVAAAFECRGIWESLPQGLAECVDRARSVCMMTRVTHRRA